MRTVDDILGSKLLDVILSILDKFRCIAFSMVLTGIQTISCSEISQKNVHGRAEF